MNIHTAATTILKKSKKMRITVKYFRSSEHWVKVSRYNHASKWAVAIGKTGQVSTRNVANYDMSNFKTWADIGSVVEGIILSSGDYSKITITREGR